MQVRRAGIAGVGAYVPPRVLTNTELEKMVDTSDEWIRTRTGVSERHIADPGVGASDLAVPACEEALAAAGIKAADLDLIIVATVSPDMPFPATAALLQDRLGAAGAAAFDLEAGCTGFIYALVMGAQTIAAGVYENVLVVGAEVLSAITDWTDRGTCVLMGDGAGAVVLRPTAEDGGIRSFQLRSDGSKGASLSMPAGGSRLPASAETVANRQHYIQMNGRDIFRFAVPILEEATRAVVAEAGLTLDDVKVIIPHQANIRIIEAAGQRLGMAPERFVCNMDRFGNTSSASVPMALHEAVKDGRVQAGDYVVLVGFGAGLTWGAALLRW